MLSAEEKKARKAAQMKKWRAANKEKIAAEGKKYYEANKEKLSAQNKKWHEDNKEKLSAQKKEWYAANRERVAQQQKEYYEANKEKVLARKKEWRAANRGNILMQQKEWYAANREHKALADKEWRTNNPGVANAKNARRRAAKLQATPPWADVVYIKSIYEKAAEAGMHVDHIIPLQGELVCGLHVECNLQLITPAENSSKGNRFDGETYVHILP